LRAADVFGDRGKIRPGISQREVERIDPKPQSRLTASGSQRTETSALRSSRSTSQAVASFDCRAIEASADSK